MRLRVEFLEARALPNAATGLPSTGEPPLSALPPGDPGLSFPIPTGPAALSPTNPEAPSTTLDVRKNQASLTAQKKADFIDALKILKTIHRPGSTLSVYDEFVYQHSQAFIDGQAHGGPAFLAWHREFLRQFELLLQTVKPGVTIPYWDFTVDNSPSSSLWKPDFLGGDGDPTDNYIVKTGPFRQGQWTLAFDGPDLRRQFGGPFQLNLPTTADVLAAFGVSTYDVYPYNSGSPIGQSFRNYVEGFNFPTGQPEMHNLVHLWVGGSMAIQYSPNDPAFWLLHANIDRLWSEWEARYGQRYAPVSGGPFGQNLNDPMSPFGVTPASVLDEHALGYEYDTERGAPDAAPDPFANLPAQDAPPTGGNGDFMLLLGGGCCGPDVAGLPRLLGLGAWLGSDGAALFGPGGHSGDDGGIEGMSGHGAGGGLAGFHLVTHETVGHPPG